MQEERIMNMEHLSFDISIFLLVAFILMECVVSILYYKSTKTKFIPIGKQLSFYLGVVLFFFVNAFSLVLNNNSVMFDMFYDMMIWFVIPPFILLGLDSFLQRLFWHYRLRKPLLFIVKPQISKWIFFFLLILYASTHLPLFFSISLKLIITISVYVLWWSLMFSTFFIQQKEREKEKITHLFLNMIIITFIMYPIYLSKEPTVKHLHAHSQLDILWGTLIFLGGYYVVSLVLIAYWFGKWSKREHVIDPINVAGWLGKSSKEDKSFNK